MGTTFIFSQHHLNFESLSKRVRRSTRFLAAAELKCPRLPIFNAFSASPQLTNHQHEIDMVRLAKKLNIASSSVKTNLEKWSPVQDRGVSSTLGGRGGGIRGRGGVNQYFVFCQFFAIFCILSIFCNLKIDLILKHSRFQVSNRRKFGLILNP